MFIRHIFVEKPLIAMAVLVCMGTILALFKLNRRKPQTRTDKFLIAFLGLLAIYEAFKCLKDSGFVSVAMNSVINDAIELLVAMTCLIAAIMLQISRANHLDAESAMRLARAAPPRRAHPESPIGARDLSTLDTLNWGIPRLSDGAFKLLAVLCLRSEAGVPVGVSDVQLKLSRSKDELEVLLKELQDSGAVALHRRGSTLNIEILTPIRRPLVPEPPAYPALAGESRV